MMAEFRCLCGKLLAKSNNKGQLACEIKCPKCGTINETEGECQMNIKKYVFVCESCGLKIEQVLPYKEYSDQFKCHCGKMLLRQPK
jgi:phage FluMu protein Com